VPMPLTWRAGLLVIAAALLAGCVQPASSTQQVSASRAAADSRAPSASIDAHCQGELAPRVCDRALATAEALSPRPISDAVDIRIHPGNCAIAMSCSYSDPTFITVDLTFADRDGVFVVIDPRNGGWSASCDLLVVEGNPPISSHTEPCDQAR
jgi:hypothetical protein